MVLRGYFYPFCGLKRLFLNNFFNTLNFKPLGNPNYWSQRFQLWIKNISKVSTSLCNCSFRVKGVPTWTGGAFWWLKRLFFNIFVEKNEFLDFHELFSFLTLLNFEELEIKLFQNIWIALSTCNGSQKSPKIGFLRENGIFLLKTSIKPKVFGLKCFHYARKTLNSKVIEKKSLDNISHGHCENSIWRPKAWYG